MRGDVIGQETGAGYDATVVVHHGVEVVAPMAGGEAIELVETTGIGMERALAAVVPFPKTSGGIAGGFENIRDGFLSHR